MSATQCSHGGTLSRKFDGGRSAILCEKCRVVLGYLPPAVDCGPTQQQGLTMTDTPSLPVCPREDCPATIDHFHDGEGSAFVCSRQLGRECFSHEIDAKRPYRPTRCYAPRTAAVCPPLRPLTEDDYRAAASAWDDTSFKEDEHGIRADHRAAADVIHDRLAADCQPAPQPIDPADVREGDRVRIVDEGTATTWRPRVLDACQWVLAPGSTVTYYLIDHPEPEDPAVAVVEEWITESLRGQAREDAIRDLLSRIDNARKAAS